MINLHVHGLSTKYQVTSCWGLAPWFDPGISPNAAQEAATPDPEWNTDRTMLAAHRPAWPTCACRGMAGPGPSNASHLAIAAHKHWLQSTALIAVYSGYLSSQALIAVQTRNSHDPILPHASRWDPTVQEDFRYNLSLIPMIYGMIKAIRQPEVGFLDQSLVPSDLEVHFGLLVRYFSCQRP